MTRVRQETTDRIESKDKKAKVLIVFVRVSWLRFQKVVVVRLADGLLVKDFLIFDLDFKKPREEEVSIL